MYPSHDDNRSAAGFRVSRADFRESRRPTVWDLTGMIGIKTVRPGDQDGGAALTTVRDIMSTELVTVDPSANVTEAARAMSTGRSGSVLVLQEGSLVGIFTERDILRALAHSPKADVARVSSVAQWIGRDPVTIGPRWRPR